MNEKKAQIFYSCLILAAILPILWQNAPDVKVNFHPFAKNIDFKYDLSWFETIWFIELKPVVYLLAIRNYQGEKLLILMFGIFEAAQFMDFFLTYGQTPFREPIGISLAIISFIQYLRAEYREWQRREQ